MQAVFLNSWQLLTPAEQYTLNRLAVCPGAFSVRAAGKMAGAALADLTRLRATGCDHVFADVATGVGRYVNWLAAQG